MERFYATRVSQLISTVRSGDDAAIEEQLLFCEQWGGPLAAAAQVALAWVVERRTWQGAERQSGGDAVEPLKPVKPAEKRPLPDWVRQHLAERYGR